MSGVGSIFGGGSNRGGQDGMIEVMFTSNDGGGYAHKKQVKEGTTLAQFFRNEKPTADPSNFNIRVNRQEQPQNYRLRQGDRITATPKKVHGA